MESAENIKCIIAGYTHLQIAMPSLNVVFCLCRNLIDDITMLNAALKL
jgi:argininosuccinate lyase